MRNRIVYVSYDGLTDPLGESQILSYMSYNSKIRDCAVYSFEKPALNGDVPRIEALCRQHDIDWHPLRYTKKPPVLSTLKDLYVGYRSIKENERLDNIICHARSYMGGIIALNLKRKHKVPFIFDMRGWWIDENIENGQFSNPVFKFVIKYMRGIERALISESDSIVSLTNCGKDVLVSNYGVSPNKISVIPTCVNFTLFNFSEVERINTRKKLGIPEDAYVLVYNGSIGGYYNVDEMLKIFYCIKEMRPNAYFLFVTKQNPEIVLAKVDEKYRSSLVFDSCRLNEMYKYLSAADLGLILYDNSFSSTGRSPTKLAEYWSIGLPVICPKGVGDLDLYFKDGVGGAQFELTNNESYQRSVKQVLVTSYDRGHIINMSKLYFDSEEGARRYNEIYERLLLQDK